MASAAALRAIGFNRGQIARRLAGRRWWRRFRGVYVLGPGKLDFRGELMAAICFAGADAAISGWDAARLDGITEGGYRGRVDVTCPRQLSAPRGIDPHRSRLPADEIKSIGAIPVTTTTRTILDCAATGDRRDVERLLERAFQLRRPMRPSFEELIDRYPGRRGIAVLREARRVFQSESRPSKSELEEAFLELIDRHRLPRPVRNYDIATPKGTFEFDLVWPDQRLVVEVDAPSTHGTRPKMLSDRRKDRGLVLAGWIPSRVMDEDLEDEVALVEELRALLER